jgi:5-methylthioribose kinase
MPYKQLSVDTVLDYIKSIDEMKKVFSDFENIEVAEIGDGNLNYVYTITNKNNPSETVVLKQAVPFLRCVGESWPLSKERMTFEIMALAKQYELAPEYVPETYYADKDMSLVIMQNLNKHKVLRGEIIKGKYFPEFAEHISTFLAKSLFYTTDWYLDHKTKKEMVRDFINIELCKITEDFVFTHPYEDNETNEYNSELSKKAINSIQKDRELKIAVADMKYKFMTSAEALIHGDLHIGSIMANEKETFVIDPEFAFFGPIGFDVGALIGNLLMSYFSHEYHQKVMGNNPYEYRKWLIDLIKDIWTKFASKFDSYWKEHIENTKPLQWDYEGGFEDAAEYRKRNIQRIFRDSIGFGACKMMRRIVGIAKVADIADIPDLKERAKIEEMVLEMAGNMVINRNSFNNIDELIELAKSMSPLE